MTTVDDLRFGRVVRAEDGTYTVRFERRLAHPPERVWTALTDPVEVRHWFTEMTMEAREGGALHLDFGEQGTAHGRVLVWEPPHLLEHSWTEAGSTSHVRWELRAHEGGTVLTLTHTELATENPHEYGAGWHDFLDRLPSHLAGSVLPVAANHFETLLERYRWHLEWGDPPPA